MTKGYVKSNASAFDMPLSPDYYIRTFVCKRWNEPYSSEKPGPAAGKYGYASGVASPEAGFLFS